MSQGIMDRDVKRFLMGAGLVVIVALAVLAVRFADRKIEEAQRAMYQQAIELAFSFTHKCSAEREEYIYWHRSWGNRKEVEGEARLRYTASLRSMPLGDCPLDFQAAYRSHIEAWAANDSDAEGRTWRTVLSVARRYGVEDQE